MVITIDSGTYSVGSAYVPLSIVMTINRGYSAVY